MNSIPKLPAAINTRGHPPEFEQLIIEKSKNFVGREFVFTAINEFLHKSHSGYFTIVGAPGSGKSAILAKYVTENPNVIYYNAQVEGKNRADEFITIICNQLVHHYPGISAIHDNATKEGGLLSLLLQKISEQLEPNQKLIIAIDALDAIDRNSQSSSSNLFYLPRYLPQKVYFILIRRPFLRDKSGLLIETPFQTLDLKDYPDQNREDARAYIQNYLTAKSSDLPSLGKAGLRVEASDSLSSPHFLRVTEGVEQSQLTTDNLTEKLTAQNENNFMYLSQILPALIEGFYPQPYQFDRLPPGLEAYYQTHWQRMIGNGLSAVELDVLRCLVTPQLPFDPPQPSSLKLRLKKGGVSAAEIAQIIDQDEYEVESVLDNWIEFLQLQQIDGETHYRFYHSSFRDWLRQQLK